MLTVWLGSVLLVIMVGLLIWTVIKYIGQTAYDMWQIGVVFSAIGTGLVLLVFTVMLGCQYSDGIYLPLKLEALTTTIEQQTEYISGIDATIGQGLEGLDIKREIQQTIRERNMLLAQIEYRQVSPWYLFKP